MGDENCTPQYHTIMEILDGSALTSLQWRHNGHDSVSNHQPHDCSPNSLLRRRSKKASKLRVTGLCAGTSPVTGEFPPQMASYAENVSIWSRHHVLLPAKQTLVLISLIILMQMDLDQLNDQ